MVKGTGLPAESSKGIGVPLASRIGGAVLGGCELVVVGGKRLAVVLEGRRAGGMAGAIADGQDAEDDERGDLNDVDGQVDGG